MRGELVVGAAFNWHGSQGNRDYMMCMYGVQQRNMEGQMMLDFKNGMEMAVVKMLDSGQYHIEEMQFDL